MSNVASILALETEVPENVVLQEDFGNLLPRFLGFTDSEARLLKKITSGSQIEKRHLLVKHFQEEMLPPPKTSERNERYKVAAPKLAESVSRKCLEQWGGSLSSITHVISVSCTGMIAPGIEFMLIRRLGLSPHVERLGINFMGCFGAFKGLAIAKALALENPRHRILMVCTELCSLHFQTDTRPDTLVGGSLFADGAAAVVVGVQPHEGEKPLFEIHNQASAALDDTLDLMTWEAGDYGYQMRLSASIPSHLENNISPFVKRLTGPTLSFENCAWAVHPGGKAILNAIVRGCNIPNEELAASWKVLRDYGNMSSPTFLFILKETLERVSLKKWVVGLGFGPGLSIEGMLLKRVDI